MENNDLVRRLRFALSIDDAEAARLVDLGGERAEPLQMQSYRIPDGSEGAVVCPDGIVAALLSGLVLDRRGPPSSEGAVANDRSIDNNTVLKRLKTALAFRSEDVRDCIVAGGGQATVSEVGAFLRRPGARNFRGLGDQALRRFLTGLARRSRPDSVPETGEPLPPSAAGVPGEQR